MSVEHIELLVEEPSMEAALRLLLPSMIGRLTFEVHSHQGKRDMLSRLPGKLRGYAAWIPETYRMSSWWIETMKTAMSSRRVSRECPPMRDS